MALTFRKYLPSDREVCLEIIESQVGSYLAPGEEKDFDEFLDALNDDIYFCVAEEDDRAVGCGAVSVKGDVATLNWGILRAGELSKGFGRAMLGHRLEWVRARFPDVKIVRCFTAPKTEGFFAKFGFRVVRREANYWGGVLELVVMERQL